MAFSKSVNMEHAQTVVPCNVCEDDEAPGEYYCKECKHTLCTPCKILHAKFTKGHTVILRTQIGEIDTITLTCTDHGDNAVFHCEKCNIQVCGQCITGKHKGHDLTGLNDIFEKEKEMLQNNLTKLREYLPTLEKRRDEILELKEKYEKEIKEITEEMEKENRGLHKELDRILDNRMKRLASVKKSHLETFDDCNTEVEKNIESVKMKILQHLEAFDKNSLPAVLNLAKENFMEHLPNIESTLHLPQPPSFVPGNEQKIEESLGKLNLSSLPVVKSIKIVSKFKSPLKSYSPICITKEGDIWLGGDKSRELVMVDIKGKVIRRRKIRNRTKMLDVLDCGDIIIGPKYEDSVSVSRLLADGKEQLVYNASPSRSYGVSVTANQDILICTKDGKVLRSYCDSAFIKQIYEGSGEGSTVHAVENPCGKIYISDCRQSAVVIINKDGIVLSKIMQSKEGQMLAWPLFLCLDKIGNVLLADRDNHCVYIIDQNQQMRELVGRSHGIQHPLRLAVDSDGYLWIAQRERNILVVQYLA